MNKKGKGYVIGFYNHANFVTVFGLLLALTSCVCAFYGMNIAIIMTFFIGSGLCDLFDGVIARKLKRSDDEKAFGVELDSLCDCVSFGVAPCLLSFFITNSAQISFRFDLIIYAFILFVLLYV
ncbi:MAG: CDP-alcohol phosphatidyltransferase family protein [Lachnospiraceae bacterium]|jgi:CDP-diacylglycerol--serine O-phosphatidyltransferase|nr:CDP-alcohol phosphatidyltransferase family protein [Lachnospiraceae bacterium]